MDLRQLEILQAIAETGSFTACGRKLHVSQSAISRQIALLEEELGEPLFLRIGRQVRMTPAAEGRRFGASFAERRIEVLEGAGHLMMLEQPAATLALLQEML